MFDALNYLNKKIYILCTLIIDGMLSFNMKKENTCGIQQSYNSTNRKTTTKQNIMSSIINKNKNSNLGMKIEISIRANE